MFFIKLLRYLKGYVCFTATGVFLERFLNLVVRKRINIWNVQKKDEVLTACVEGKAYKQLRPCAQKTGVRLRIKQRYGAPFRVRRYRKRTGLWAGILFFLLFLGAMGQFIWRVEVKGNVEVSSAQILSTVSAMGLKVGALKLKMNARELERRTMLELQRLSWVAINLEGSTCTIEVHERVMPPPMLPVNDKPCNVIASRTGVILYMEVYAGQSVRKVGDTVKAGEVIVSGVMEDQKGHTTYRHARARVMAQTDWEITVEAPFVRTVKTPTGVQKHRRYLRVFGADLPLFLYRPFQVAYDLKREVRPLAVLGLPLPLSFVEETYDFYVLRQEKLTPADAKQEALRCLAKAEQEQLAGAELCEKVEEHRELDDMHILTVKYLCNIDIAKEQEISIKQ